MSEYPKEIYLQDIGGEITWCTEPIEDLDNVKYFHHAKFAELRKTIERLNALSLRLLENANQLVKDLGFPQEPTTDTECSCVACQFARRHLALIEGLKDEVDKEAPGEPNCTMGEEQ
ncbi:MAG TPA: hypothetical protein PK040_02025 [Anaerolineaceae bacterium]|nr:hypothetical protein [Anaerolineaceae bacterium]